MMGSTRQSPPPSPSTSQSTINLRYSPILIDEQILSVGGDPLTINLAGAPVFTDPDDDGLSYSVVSSDATIATASISDNTLTITPVGEGTITLTVTADDGKDNGRFTAIVIVTVAANVPPRLVNPLGEQSLSEDSEPLILDLNDPAPFVDPDGDNLTLEVSSSDENVVTTEISNGVLTVTPVGRGSATVTVTAEDGRGGVSSAAIQLAVIGVAHVSADIQSGSEGDRVLQQTGTVSVKPSESATIELFASGFDGALGMVATFSIDRPEGLAQVKANMSDIFQIVLGAGVSVEGNTLKAEFGNLGVVSDEGDGLKLVGSITLTPTDEFEEMNLSLQSVIFEPTISSATPDVALTVTPGSEFPNPDFDGNGTIGFRDFILFAAKYGTSSADANFDPSLDLDLDGTIGFRDFILFAQVYGLPASAYVPPGGKLVLSKAAGN